MNVKNYWKSVLQQDAVAIRAYFSDNAYVNWHCSNERFTVDEFIRANCEYPGCWHGTVERIEQIGNLIVTATRVFDEQDKLSFHVVSLIHLEHDKIVGLDEYWGDDGIAPQWRLEKKIGKPIR